MATPATYTNIAYPIRIIIPIVYSLITGFALIGNLLNFYSLCVSSDRYARKGLHVLVWNLVVEGSIWSSIFCLVKMVSFADLGEHFALNGGQWLNDSWCKSEMYLLRAMDFLLAYTLVFLCLDRCVRRKVCCYGVRRFVTGVCIVVSLWLAICYALIPILFFDQELISFSYGSYECQTNSTQINQLDWLDLQKVQTPLRTIYLLDFIFGNALPVFCMLLLLFLRFLVYRRSAKKIYQPEGSSNPLEMNTYKQLDLSDYDDEHPNLTKMVVLYVIVYIVCQLPYYIYRLIRIYSPSIEANLRESNLLYAIDIPLIALRLINRAINPWLSFFLMRSLRDSSRRACSSLWCCPTRWSCLRDCSLCLRNEWYDLTANHQMIREIRPTGNTMKKEFIDSTGKRVKQTFEEYIRYYHRPRSNFRDANPALLLAGRHTPAGNDLLPYPNNSHLQLQHPSHQEPSTEL